MLDFMDIAVFIGMLLLRVGVPALVIVAIGYGLKRLDRRWEAEAREYQAKHPTEQPGVQPVAPQPARRPGKQPATPQPLPFIPPQTPSREQRPGLYAGAGAPATPSRPTTPGALTGTGLSAAGARCWDEKNCSPSKRAECAASSHPDQPCWQARLSAEGHIPEECVSCDIFQRYPSM